MLKNEEEIMGNTVIIDLKKTLLDYVASNERLQVINERTLAKFTRIMNWIWIIAGGMAISIIIGLAVIINLVSQPAPATAVAMKQLQELSNSITMQKKFNDLDRQDIALARAQYAEMIKQFSESMKRDTSHIILKK